MIKNIFLNIIFFLFYFSLHAQYHLDEIGMQFGAGTNLPIGSDIVSPFYAYNTCAFYSRYRCGKKDGFQIDAGVRGFEVTEKATDNSFLIQGNNLDMRYHFINLFLGAYYKFRFKDFHRDNEVAFLIGTKGDFRFTSLHISEPMKTQRYNSDDYRKLSTFLPGISASLWIRRALAPRKTFFIRPGIDYYLKNTVKTVPGQAFESLHLYLNIGVIFWNNL